MAAPRILDPAFVCPPHPHPRHTLKMTDVDAPPPPPQLRAASSWLTSVCPQLWTTLGS